MLPTKFRFIWLNGFRGEEFFRNQASMDGPLLILLISSRSINKHGHHRQFLFLIGRFLKNLLESKKTANQKKELPVAAMFVSGSGRNEHSL
jgi:hypothetical protein